MAGDQLLQAGHDNHNGWYSATVPASTENLMKAMWLSAPYQETLSTAFEEAWRRSTCRVTSCIDYGIGTTTEFAKKLEKQKQSQKLYLLEHVSQHHRQL